MAAAANPDAFLDDDKHREARRLPRSSRAGVSVLQGVSEGDAGLLEQASDTEQLVT